MTYVPDPEELLKPLYQWEISYVPRKQPEATPKHLVVKATSAGAVLARLSDVFHVIYEVVDFKCLEFVRDQPPELTRAFDWDGVE